MVYEIQKNFLLSDCALLENLKKDNIPFRNSKFETFYTQITSNHSVKFQSFCNEFYKITKFNNSILEQNQEEKISKKKFEKARKKIIGKSIKKERFEFKFCSLKSYIDIYEEPKICILKIFFPTLDSSNEFKIPKDFKIQKELHHDLNSKHIVLYGFEYQNFDIEKCFKIIEKNQNFSLDFPNYINAYDGFRIFLFYLFKKLKFYWTLSLERKDKQSLCEFLFYSRSLYIVLSSMNTILDKNLSNILALKFKDITKKTQDILASENSNQDLLLFLSDEKIQDLFNDFDFFIKENSFYEGDCKDRFFKQLVALELRKKIILFRKNILKNFDLELFENSFFELAIFLEYFYR
ncbi:hypothetical protein P0L62_000987, partial [Campylobacter jejuni]|nr:hypothetical protein [Campylobacter jejuni]